MDASPTGGGLCAAELPSDAVKELWRFSEQKRFYTKLLEPAGAILATAGLEDDPGAFFAESVGDATVGGLSFGSEPLPLRRPLSSPGLFLHLLAQDETWAQAHSAAGLRAASVQGPVLSGSLRFQDLGSDSVFHGLCCPVTMALSLTCTFQLLRGPFSRAAGIRRERLTIPAPFALPALQALSTIVWPAAFAFFCASPPRRKCSSVCLSLPPA